ncbi:hypothetical protein [Streptomyces sp. uw30]|uniref:hypothetical protein n=1 Tax=Streptomyces sp. uw30 TaxID=1828179 RepID=UPI0016514415|nr:hypothetical protein [Streptomyces sp. uw30]
MGWGLRARWPGAELVAGLQAQDWNQALRSLALAVPDDSPSIAVIKNYDSALVYD